MNRKYSIVVILSIAAVLLASCSSAQSAQTGVQSNDQSQPAAQSQPQTQGQATDQVNGQAPQGTPSASNANLTIERKLAAGTLKLEGTNLAVTADEAKKLLPLWQQIKTMSADTNSSADQIQAVYDQIKSAMTNDQIQAIDKLSFSDMQSLMTSLGIQLPTGMPGFGRNLSGTPGAAPSFQGTPNPGGGPTRSGTPGARPNFQGTPGSGRGGNGGMMESAFIDPLITLLQQRAGN